MKKIDTAKLERYLAITESYLNFVSRNPVGERKDASLATWILQSRINRDLLVLLLQAKLKGQSFSYSELQEAANISRNTVKSAIRQASDWGLVDIAYTASKAEIQATDKTLEDCIQWLDQNFERLSSPKS